jgi:hypothetical protein
VTQGNRGLATQKAMAPSIRLASRDYVGRIRSSCRVTAPSRASFDLRSNGRIGRLKRGPRPRGTASGDANEREQDEENAKCSPIVGHRTPFAFRNSRRGQFE